MRAKKHLIAKAMKVAIADMFKEEEVKYLFFAKKGDCRKLRQIISDVNKSSNHKNSKVMG
jgi:hypothetical protein